MSGDIQAGDICSGYILWTFTLADDLVCTHAIDVWKHAVEYMQQQQARAGGAHQ